jgi:hypothetical protein
MCPDSNAVSDVTVVPEVRVYLTLRIGDKVCIRSPKSGEVYDGTVCLYFGSLVVEEPECDGGPGVGMLTRRLMISDVPFSYLEVLRWERP